ncbi:hypothetical protein VO226_08280 [Halomonas elongata]|uniref:hypothetical protein n=1 Tax=Halomonas elongata TaxID=2746 RepID=UPI002E2C1828|nr:hypothetical protein [Halomonas elongata]WVI73229.1 hypothetical protein VO226_08280 [Halomonas elongata]
MASYQNTLGINLPGPSASQTAETYVDPQAAFQGDQGASDTIGRLSRAQWEDWKARFRPYIDSLANAATRNEAAQDAATMAQESMATAYDNSAQAQDMQRQGMGLQVSQAQRGADQRRRALQKTASMVSAGNQARMSAQDRQSKILAGGMGLSSIPDKILESQ